MNIQTVTFQDISFINVTSPGKLEVKYLKNNFGFDTLHLEDYLSNVQTPKAEIFKKYTLVVLGFPVFNKNSVQNSTKIQEKTSTPLIESLLGIPKATLSSVPLPQFSTPEKRKRILGSQVDFFIGKDYLVVLHEGILSPINDIFSLCQKTLHNRHEFMANGPVFLAYRIIDALVDSCFPIINELSATIDEIDRELENPQSEKTLESISLTRRNIVVLHTMIKPIIPLFKQIEEGKYKELNGNMQSFWGNVLDHLQKIWDRLEDNQELLEGISVSHESFLTSKTNEIIKVLTIFSAIILPLNLLASIYGMNIKGLPVAEDQFVFILLIIFMFGISLGMLLVFKIKRWF